MMTLLVLAATIAVNSRTLGAPPFEYTSRYLTMRDGVRIAVDLYLPRKRGDGTRLPTVLHQTRYFRAHRVMWPVSLFWRGVLEPTIARYVANGYAYVVVDARGSGASFGTRTQEWSPDEVQDGAEVVDWIVKQQWSNGRVGTTGVSYDGTAADFLLTNRHRAVAASVPRSGLYDAYTDLAFPGGIKLAPLIEFWSRVTAAQDSNRFNSVLSGFAKLAYRGVKPVQGDSGEQLLEQAAREHAANYHVSAGIGRIEFRDQTDQVRAMSPYAQSEAIQQSGAAIYSMSGWYDGAMMNGAIKRFLSIRTEGSRLILGPWSHQGENLSPFAAQLHDFDHTAETIRFFDAYLKGERNDMEDAPSVRYYTVGEERWKSAATWPPPGTVPLTLYFAKDRTLAPERPTEPAADDQYVVDLTAGSGQETRWNNLTALDVVHSIARDRRERDKKLLVYTGIPLRSDLEMTGHPIVTLELSSTEPDGAVFVYLEDVAPNGEVYYVTDGQLRLLHRRVSTSPPPYQFPGPYRTFETTDTASMPAGKTEDVTFDLYPISYLFRAGHSIRVSIAGADVDHFGQISKRAPTLTISRDAVRSSRIVLPMMPR